MRGNKQSNWSKWACRIENNNSLQIRLNSDILQIFIRRVPQVNNSCNCANLQFNAFNDGLLIAAIVRDGCKNWIIADEAITSPENKQNRYGTKMIYYW